MKRFSKPFTQQESIPEKGIEQAIEVLRSGRLHRYNTAPGELGEAATLAFLFSLAEALEDRAMDRAKEGLRALLSLIPETARVSRLDSDLTIPASEVRELDILIAPRAVKALVESSDATRSV